MTYIPTLDGLRGYAVLLVLMQHWLGNDHSLNTFNNGLIGVTLFYVLSGFLITGILLQNKRVSTNLNWKVALKTFWVRRVLRIFPIYYLIIFLLVLIGFQDIRGQLFYFVSYMQNILFYSSKENFGYMIHFWSLAIEEQFYLIWPLLIFLVRADKVLLLISITILTGIIFRMAIHHEVLPLEINPVNYHLLGSIDLFGYGALLAFLFSNNLLKEKMAMIILGSLFAVLVLLQLFSVYTDYLSFIGSLSMLLIFTIIRYPNSLVRVIFGNPLIKHFGRISYGVYLFHYFMYPLNHWLHDWCLRNHLKWPFIDVIIFPEFSNIYLRFVYFLFLTIVFALASWFFIEKPFLNLKAKFNYDKSN